VKFIHLSDLHLGKRVNEFPMIEDQAYILEQILAVIDQQTPDAVIIAGDVYDRTIPSAEAVTLLDDFLVKLAQRHVPVLLVSGNHDSPERVAFAGRLMEHRQVYISPVYRGETKTITLTDEYGPVDFFLLPFLKPVHVRACFPDEEINDTNDAVACAVRHMQIDSAHRNVLVAHQFVTGAERCESEELSIGGSDNVDISVFAPFDYAALGHLHGPQTIRNARYCGSPLKYSFSEAHHKKSVTVVCLGPKGTLSIDTVPLVPRRDMVELRGTYREVASLDFYRELDTDAYIRMTLTDEQDVPNAMDRLRSIYPNMMRLDYDNLRTRGGGQAALDAAAAGQQTPLQVFAALYMRQNNAPMSPEQEHYLSDLIERIWEEDL